MVLLPQSGLVFTDFCLSDPIRTHLLGKWSENVLLVLNCEPRKTFIERNFYLGLR